MTAMTTEHMNGPGGVTAVLDRPGARLVYEVAGDGPAVILIHGFGLDLRMWDPQVAALADRFRVVLVAVGERDVPGFREMSAVLARRIPGAAYQVITGAGHLTSMEQPAAVSDLLTQFVLDGVAWSR